MKIQNLTKKEMRNLEGGWIKTGVGMLVSMILDAIDNPNDFKKGFNSVVRR